MSLWQRWWRMPQRVWLRRAAFQVHLWFGLILGLYIVMLSVTGSILVYRIDLDRWFATPVPAFDAERPLVSKDTITASAMQAYPGWEIVRQGERVSRRVPAIGVTLARNGEQTEQLFDPYTGQHLGVAFTEGQEAVLWLVSLHDDLLFDRDGRWWNGIGSAFATLLVLTGLLVWWPGVTRWKRSLSVKLTGGWRRFTWDLHSAAGLLPVRVSARVGRVGGIHGRAGPLLMAPRGDAPRGWRREHRRHDPGLADAAALRPVAHPVAEGGVGGARAGPRDDVRHRHADVVESRGASAAARQRRRASARAGCGCWGSELGGPEGPPLRSRTTAEDRSRYDRSRKNALTAGCTRRSCSRSCAARSRYSR